MKVFCQTLYSISSFFQIHLCLLKQVHFDNQEELHVTKKLLKFCSMFEECVIKKDNDNHSTK
jgi:hypothetical protein